MQGLIKKSIFKYPTHLMFVLLAVLIYSCGYKNREMHERSLSSAIYEHIREEKFLYVPRGFPNHVSLVDSTTKKLEWVFDCKRLLLTTLSGEYSKIAMGSYADSLDQRDTLFLPTLSTLLSMDTIFQAQIVSSNSFINILGNASRTVTDSCLLWITPVIFNSSKGVGYCNLMLANKTGFQSRMLFLVKEDKIWRVSKAESLIF